MRFCNYCGTPVAVSSQQTDQWNQGVPEKPAGRGAAPKAGSAKKASKKKSKGWLIPVIIAAVLAMGAGIFFLFFHGTVDVNNYLVPSVSGNSGNYSVRIGLDAARMVKENQKTFAVTDGNRSRIKSYLRQTFPSLSMDTMVDLAVQLEMSKSAYNNTVLTEDETLAELALLAALADSTALGGDRGPLENLDPEVKKGYLSRSGGLSEGEKIRFTWSGADTAVIKDLFGARLKCGDTEFTLKSSGGTGPTSASPVAVSTTPAYTEPVTAAPTEPAVPATEPTTQPTVPVPVTEPATEPPTEAPTEPVTEPPTEPPTEPTTEAPTEPPTVPSTEPEETALPVTSLRFRDIYEGMLVTFGEYEQDNNTANGPEPIEWILYYKGIRNVYMVSRYILDVKPFSKAGGTDTFASSTLDRWLEGDYDSFMNTAFTKAERSLLAEQDLDPPKNSHYPATKQTGLLYRYVAIFSVNELIDYLPAEFYQATGTPYALAKGLKVEDGYSPWWTRTMGKSEKYACVVPASGKLDNYEGTLVTKEYIGVRPVICISNELFGQLGFGTAENGR